jgi:hypothetical protein
MAQTERTSRAPEQSSGDVSSQVSRFFDLEIKAIAVESRAIAHQAARELQRDVMRQIRRNFRNPSAAFSRGVKVYEYESAAYVRLSPVLSSHAQSTKLQGNPNLWILLPDGARLGFKRLGKGFDWNTLKRRYGSALSFVAVRDGHVVLYRHNGVVRPIYKLQSAVTTKQRIEFYEKAEAIADRNGFDYNRGDREISFK